MTDDRSLLDEQILYYRARADEYDATSPIPHDRFAAETEQIRAALRAFEPRGRVLELAAGTGQWTGLLAETATDLTAIDASPEVLRLNAAKVRDPRVRYRVADIFELEPSGDWDVVFFSAWLSHVPMARFVRFWRLVADLLAPGGRVFFIDEARHDLWAEDWLDRDAGVVQRALNDGTVHRLVKILWRADELAARLRALGWDVEIEASGPFYWGSGVTRPATRETPRPLGRS